MSIRRTLFFLFTNEVPENITKKTERRRGVISQKEKKNKLFGLLDEATHSEHQIPIKCNM
jgi:hypothetical protein